MNSHTGLPRHTHAPEHAVQFPSGTVQQICECGASRYLVKGVAQPWHTCALCTHPWGLPALQIRAHLGPKLGA